MTTADHPVISLVEDIGESIAPTAVKCKCPCGGAWRFGEILPAAALGAMAEADRVVIINSDMDVFFSKGMKELLGGGLLAHERGWMIPNQKQCRIDLKSKQEAMDE